MAPSSGVPAGYTTYHINAVLTNEYDFVSAVYGDAENPMSIQSTGDILQVGTGGHWVKTSIPFFSTCPGDRVRLLVDH